MTGHSNASSRSDGDGRLGAVRGQGRKIFMIEDLTGSSADSVRNESHKLGFMPFFGPRDLRSAGN